MNTFIVIIFVVKLIQARLLIKYVLMQQNLILLFIHGSLFRIT